MLLTELDAVIVKGAVWAAGALDAAWAPLLLERVFARTAAHNAAVANACVNVLGQLGGPDAPAVLSRLAATVKDRGYRKLIDRALSEAATRLGVSPTQLLERVVPAYGLEADGRRELELGEWTAVLEVEPERVVTRWRGPGGEEQKTTPSALKESPSVAEVKAAAKEVRKALSTERARVESLLAEDAAWPYTDWREAYRDHPLVGVLARRLFWRFHGEVALGEDAPEQAEEVRLWHPATAPAEEVQALRRTLLEREMVQPFKQAFREVYVLDAGREGDRGLLEPVRRPHPPLPAGYGR